LISHKIPFWSDLDVPRNLASAYLPLTFCVLDAT
jgi:hypothetical protein